MTISEIGSSIIDNRNGNTLLKAIENIGADGKALKIASAFFSLDGLLLLADTLEQYENIRILFGDDSSKTQSLRLLELLRIRSDEALLSQRMETPLLAPLQKVESLFRAGRVEVRCYIAQKFHAKAYLCDRPAIYPLTLGILGSGNFTRPGLLQNIELNVHLTTEQTVQMDAWFEERWREAAQDVVTDDILKEIQRQIDLYDPHVIYLKALLEWGRKQEAEGHLGEDSILMQTLDVHQEQGFRQALHIIEKQHGVMICDGVGLGKSFIGLALMEYYCKQGKRILLIAPKNIMNTSWNGYVENYLSEYGKEWGRIHQMAMTDFGFEPQEKQEDTDDARLREKWERNKRLMKQADIVLIDESHNFRTTSASRYTNLFQVLREHDGKRKKVILMTATPINTQYRDMSAQLALITHDHGNIGGYPIEKIRRTATYLDRKEDIVSKEQLTLSIFETPDELLRSVFENVVLQRSRATCKAMAETSGKAVLFPERRGPETIPVRIGEESEAYRDLISQADKRFRPTAAWLKRLADEIKSMREKDASVIPKSKRRKKEPGITLAAYLTEQYRKEPEPGKKVYQDEVRLAELVFANALKQLESSPVAFQGILQSLAEGLVARLRYVFGKNCDDLIQEHQDWIRTPLFPNEKAHSEAEEDDDADDEDISEDGGALDATGDEIDDWLEEAVRARGLRKKLADFKAETHDIDKWRDDILSDLSFLNEIHQATLEARNHPDPKMMCILPVLRRLLNQRKRILLFTQSRRTAEYLEKELKSKFTDYGIARIDSGVEKTRAAILHAFCPHYNPEAHAPSIPSKIDILISTDVLSEGVNLQEAGAIVSFDIHWNPVRLIQRIGRVDRRLDPQAQPQGQSFDIVNVLPADEINDIINLVGTVENRTLRISNSLGLDVSFFQSTDPAGNLKEFNANYEGEMRPVDQAVIDYTKLKNDPDALRKLEALPDGAFGVWGSGPEPGLFALFTMEPTANASENDEDKFAAVIGKPVLAFASRKGGILCDAGAILNMLRNTRPGEKSVTPSDEEDMKRRLKEIRNKVRDQFSHIGLPATIFPKLNCWMEIR
jgi:superfamily II DNA or RNA helicase/HKD family nuclease